MKYKEKKTVIEVMKKLRNFCSNNQCEKCFLLDKNGECFITRGNPASWDIPNLPGWTEEDVRMAEVLKAAGVKEIRRTGFNGLITMYIQYPYVHGDYLPKSTISERLEEGRLISLDNIVEGE